MPVGLEQVRPRPPVADPKAIVMTKRVSEDDWFLVQQVPVVATIQ